MKKHFILCIIIIISTAKLQAQMFYEEGFIITSNNKKKSGKIKQITNEEIIFIDSLNIKSRLNTKELSYYSIDNFKFIPQQILINSESKSVFLKEVLVGYISLYELPKLTKDIKFVIRNSQNQFIALSKTKANTEFRKVMFETTEPTIMKELNDGYFQYSQTFMTNILKKYNQHERPNSTTIEPKRPFKVNYGILVGFSMNTLKYLDPATPQVYPTINLTGNLSSHNDIPIGIFFNFFPNKPLSTEIEAYYHSSKGENTVKFQAVANQQIERVYLKENGISIPINLKLKIPVRPLDFYLKAGPKFVFIQKIEGLRTDLNIKTDYPILSPDNFKKGVGYNIGLGFEKSINPKLISKIEYRFSSHTILDAVNNIAINKSHQLVFGIGIRKK